MRHHHTLALLVGLLGLQGSLASAQPPSQAELIDYFEKLKSSDLEVKNRASRNLLEYSKWWIKQDVATMRESLPAVLGGLADPDPAVRVQASAHFGLVAMLRSDDLPEILSGTVEEIISHFEDPNDQVRGNLIRALAVWDPTPSQDAITLFVDALQDPSSEVRAAAAFGLVRAAPESDSAAQLIADTLDSLDPEARRGLIHTLRSAQADHPIIVQKLVEQLDQGHRLLTFTAAKALGALGSKAGQAIPKLRAILEDPETDDELRAAAESALRTIEQGSRRR